jgi:hypothetical protein
MPRIGNDILHSEVFNWNIYKRCNFAVHVRTMSYYTGPDLAVNAIMFSI